MKKSEYLGWQEVFRFSLEQGMKAGAYKGFLIIMAVVLILSQPVMAFINNRDKEEDAYHCEVTEFTIYDEVGLPIDYTKALNGEGFEDVKINVTPNMSFDDHVKLLEEKSKDKEGEKSKELILHMVYEEAGYFNLTFVKASNAAIKDDDSQKLVDTFKEYFDKERINAIQVTQEQMDFLNRPVDTKFEFVTETGEVVPEKEGNEAISMEEYMMILFGITGVTMVINLCGGSIANSIVTEKATRVVEYLMINIRPMALIIGKILSSLLMVLIQFAVMFISYAISGLLKTALFGEEVVTSTSTGAMEGDIEVSAILNLLSGISIPEIIVAIVVILCGIMFFCILAGLAGASVSKQEELAEGMKTYNMLGITGSYLAIAVCIVMLTGGDNQLFINICSLIPIATPFVVPVCVLLDKIPMSIALIGLGILLVATGFLFSFTAKVYESMIFYNGKVLKLKDILQIAKVRKQGEGKGEKSHE